MVPEDPSLPCTSAAELGIDEYYASFSSPGEKVAKRLIKYHINSVNQKTGRKIKDK